MRKQNIGFLFDKILWFIIYTLPIWTWLIYASKGFTFNNSLYDDNIVFGQVIYQFAGGLISNPVFRVLNGIFGNTGPIPFDDTAYGIVLYLSYFCVCVIVHIIVDVLLFIPRWCHKMIRKGEDYVED